MATRLGSWSFLAVGFASSIVAIPSRAQSASSPTQNQARYSPPDAVRQPIDPNLQRAPQSMTARSAPVQPQPLFVAPPFTLTPQEQADLDVVLRAWEQQSQSVKYFKCTFGRLEFNPAFTGGNPDQPTTESHGEIKFAAPDKGMFRVLQMSNFVADPKTGKWLPQKAKPTEWWTCDGKSMFQVDDNKKEVVETPLPPEMQGTAIADGPLPFVFGAKAEALKKRYLMRNITPPSKVAKEVWLDMRPMFQKDAATFSKVELILNRENMQLKAMQIFNPGAGTQNLSRTMVTFENQSINNLWAPLTTALNDFSRPSQFGFSHRLQTTAVAAPENVNATGNVQVPGQVGRTQPPRR